MRIWLAAVTWLAVAACDSSEPPPAPSRPPVVIAEAEIKRGVDACTSYVEQICACQAEGAKQQCALAKAMPEAIEIARRLAINPKADPADARQAAGSIRKTVKQCIEQIARLPELGCS